jgi:ferrous iron transport protein A
MRNRDGWFQEDPSSMPNAMFPFLPPWRSAPRVRSARIPASLADLREGEEGTLDRIDLSPDQAHHLMELGFIPGARVRAGRLAPAGDPRVYLVEGTEVALRRETARRVRLLRPPAKEETA